ncbi:hypothetical protein HMPREF9080_01319 [Cardiobacterium valvarum F0432]|uniref:Uncharacterized protein n=1 Tax=Cardiobacterium valvarum F0432 TaxID=797473 RepID=G9ZEX9_9GAMM|nr:hypothetical protein HMPREF9080_01319 [Cardiobacterium valvarum F0432]
MRGRADKVFVACQQQIAAIFMPLVVRTPFDPRAEKAVVVVHGVSL